MDTRFDRIIPIIVEAMLPRHSALSVGLAMQLRHSVEIVSKKSGETINNIAMNVAYLFVRPSNYTKVFTKVGEFPDKFLGEHEWFMTCDHDSCWRSDGLSNLFDVEQHCKTMFETDEDRELTSHTSFELVGEPQYHVLTKMEKLQPKENYCRNWKINIAEKLNTDQIVPLLIGFHEKQKRGKTG